MLHDILFFKRDKMLPFGEELYIRFIEMTCFTLVDLGQGVFGIDRDGFDSLEVIRVYQRPGSEIKIAVFSYLSVKHTAVTSITIATISWILYCRRQDANVLHVQRDS